MRAHPRARPPHPPPPAGRCCLLRQRIRGLPFAPPCAAARGGSAPTRPGKEQPRYPFGTLMAVGSPFCSPPRCGPEAAAGGRTSGSRERWPVRLPAHPERLATYWPWRGGLAAAGCGVAMRPRRGWAAWGPVRVSPGSGGCPRLAARFSHGLTGRVVTAGVGRLTAAHLTCPVAEEYRSHCWRLLSDFRVSLLVREQGTLPASWRGSGEWLRPRVTASGCSQRALCLAGERLLHRPRSSTHVGAVWPSRTNTGASAGRFGASRCRHDHLLIIGVLNRSAQTERFAVVYTSECGAEVAHVDLGDAGVIRSLSAMLCVLVVGVYLVYCQHSVHEYCFENSRVSIILLCLEFKSSKTCIFPSISLDFHEL